MHFTVYNHSFTYDNGKLITRQFIVLKHDNGLLQFTDFHKYIKNAYRVEVVTSDGNSRFKFIAKLLNYAFFVCGIAALNMQTADIAASFLQAYGMCTLPDDNEQTHRTEDTVKRCVRVVLDFCIELSRTGQCAIKEEQLYTTRFHRDKHGKTVQVKAPVFDVKYKSGVSRQIFRDIPDKAFRILMDHIIMILHDNR